MELDRSLSHSDLNVCRQHSDDCPDKRRPKPECKMKNEHHGVQQGTH